MSVCAFMLISRTATGRRAVGVPLLLLLGADARLDEVVGVLAKVVLGLAEPHRALDHLVPGLRSW